MNSFSFRTIPTPQGVGIIAPDGIRVGAACVRHTVRHSQCQSCISVCPVAAITMTERQVQIDGAKCVACAACLFACPTAALENLAPPLRHYRDNILVEPLTFTAPGVDELVMWHVEYQIRAVEFDSTKRPHWMMAIAALNIKLKQLQQPLWQIIPPTGETIDNSRRHWLRINSKNPSPAKNNALSKNSKIHVASATPGKKTRRAYLPMISEYRLELDATKCFLCGACARICPETAIVLNSTHMTLTHSACTGCGNCAAVCFARAIEVQENIEVPENYQSNQTSLMVQQASCPTCHHPFITWPEHTGECPTCQRHLFRMREA